MTADARKILDEYLSELGAQLDDLSPSDRAEIILEVREHYEDARRELQAATEADLRNIVERLGPPAEIAAEARQRLLDTAPILDSNSPSVPPLPPQSRSGAGPLEVVAVVAWIVWLPLGILLMSLSSRWTRRHKATAIVVELTAIAVLIGLWLTPAYLTPHYSASHVYLWVPVELIFPPTLLGIFGAGYLSWKLATPAIREWRRSWRVAGRVATVVVAGWLLWVLVLGPLTFLVVKNGG